MSCVRCSGQGNLQARCCKHAVLTKLGLQQRGVTRVTSRVGQNRIYTPYMTVYLQRGLTEPKKGVFKMWIEHGRQSLLCLNLASRGSPCSKLLTAPELEHSNLRRTCLIFRGMDPTFHHKIFTADHPLHQMAYFCVVLC
jgi:hypothetical protein